MSCTACFRVILCAGKAHKTKAFDGGERDMIRRITCRQVMRGLLIAAAVIILLVLLFWKLPFKWQIDSLNLPEGCVTVYSTRVEFSDVYWPHIQGEKVLACEQGYEAAKEYIESHNSDSKLLHISVWGYGSMSDMYLYDSEYDPYFVENWDADNYVKIVYFLRL